jgi:hypothetical protein
MSEDQAAFVAKRVAEAKLLPPGTDSALDRIATALESIAESLEKIAKQTAW